MFGEQGNEPGQFNNPTGVCYDQKNQRILVSDRNNNRIQIFDKQGRFLKLFGSEGSNNGQFQYPEQICLQPNTNNILVADKSNHRVQQFNENGDFKAVIGKGLLNEPTSVACSLTTENMVVVDFCGVNEGKAHLFNPEHCKLIRSFGSKGNEQNQFDCVQGVCFDDERKRILIVDGDCGRTN